MNVQDQCLEINVPGEAFPLRFKTKQEVGDWITQEGLRWNFLNVEGAISGEFRAAVQNIKNHWAAIPDGEFSINIQNPSSKATIDQLHTAFSSELNVRLLPSDSSKGKQILSLVDSQLISQQEAAWAYGHATKILEQVDLPLNTASKIKGAVIGFLIKIGARPYDEKKLKENLDNLFAKGEEQLKAIEENRSTAIERLKKLEDDYTNKMALKAPVEYWKARSNKHSKKATIFFSAFAGWLLFWAGLSYKYLLPLLNSEVASTIKDDPRSAITHDKFLEMPIFYISVLAVIIVFWIARQFLRTYLSHYHLFLDAEERAIAIQTYLALLHNEKNAIANSERQLVLSTIFRPTATGMVQEDSGPPSSLNYIQGLIAGREK
jgi:hypothetical protein